MSRNERQRARHIANKAMQKYKDKIELAKLVSYLDSYHIKDIGDIDVKIPRGKIDVSPDLFESFINKAADRVGINTKSIGIDFGEIAGVPLPPGDPTAQGPYTPVKLFTDWPGGTSGFGSVGPSRNPNGSQWSPPTPGGIPAVWGI